MDDRKALGAYYTDTRVADFLAWWAIRAPGDVVLDPCFGGGVFLRSACHRLATLGGNPEQVLGVEVDPSAHRAGGETFPALRGNLRCADFFGVDPGDRADVVIGNPPFIRYQRFAGEARKQALACALAQGVRLSALCSSWAPFLVHSVAMLRPGGRLAMVLPTEAGHAKYARPVLEFLRRSFGSLTLLTFRERLFPELSEGALLLLAGDKGGRSPGFALRDLSGPGQLHEIAEWDVPGTRSIDGDEMASGATRLVEHWLPPEARDLYRGLRARARRLGEVADVGIGYVTGANEFFHPDPDAARDIPAEFLRPAVRRARAFPGIRFTEDDWRQATARGDAGFLLAIGKDAVLPESVREYLRRGDDAAQAFKCRTRSPWYSVPHVRVPDAFLTYMSGLTPRLVSNHAGASAPNSLLVLRVLDGTPGDALAALWQTSLTKLSAEIEGHALGGGMLKLEPTEAGNVLVAEVGSKSSAVTDLAGELDAAVRAGADVQGRADAAILGGMLGLTEGECALLRSATDALRARRGYRGET